MMKYANLLEEIASSLNIQKGINESEIEHTKRVVYSALGKLSLASLWDSRDENEDISITHFKNRIGQLAKAYSCMYPELKADLLHNFNDISKEIYEIYLSTGYIYHSPHRISPATWTNAKYHNLVFHRGQPINQNLHMSGLGFYRLCGESDEPMNKLLSMFCLADRIYYDYWVQVTESAQWSAFHGESQYMIEYLRTRPSFQQGYWINRPDRKQNSSMLRVGENGLKLYYLYRYENEKLLTSQLPEWMIQEGRYRELAAGCLSSLGTLPASKYQIDGHIVHIQFGYLLPPCELNFVKLYSWPENFGNISSGFSRVMDKKVFLLTKEILEQTGFTFVEV